MEATTSRRPKQSIVIPVYDERWALGLLTAGGLGLRVAYLFQPLRHDEAMTYLLFARQPLAEALSRYDIPNNHLLHTLLVHGATRLLGDAPWALRLPALVAGVLVIPVTYLLTHRLYGRAAAVLAAALSAGSSLMVEFSVNARGYGLMTLGVLLAAWLTSHLLETPRVGGWLLWGALVALGAYAIPLMALPAGALGTWIVLAVARAPDPSLRRQTFRGLALGVLTAGVLAAALYAPVLLALGPARASEVVGHGAGPALRWADGPSGFAVHVHQLWQSWHRNCHTPVALVLGAGATLAVVLHRRLGRHAVPLAAATLPFVLVLGALEVTRPRLALFAAPLYYATAAAGLAFLLERILRPRHGEVASGAAALGLLVLLGATELRSQHVYWSNETGAARDAVALADYLATALRPGDVLLHARAPIAYHLEKRGVPVRDANVPNERATRTPLYYLGPPPEVPPPRPRRMFLVVDHAPRAAPPGRRSMRNEPTLASTLAFRGFPSLASRTWRVVHDVNEATVYVLAAGVRPTASAGSTRSRPRVPRCLDRLSSLA